MPERLPAIPYVLHVDPFREHGLLVAEFKGRETLSAPYSFDITAYWPGLLAATDLPSVGSPATFVWLDSETVDDPPRMIHGVLSRVAHSTTTQDRQNSWVRFRLVPRFWMLKRTRRRAIFQDMTPNAIVDAVLSQYNIQTVWHLDSPLPPLGFIVQYDESDFAFVHRLLARFGVFYWFDQPRGQPCSTSESVVFSSAARQYPAIARDGLPQPLALKIADHDNTYHFVEDVLEFHYERVAAPTTIRQRDWDMRSPNAWGDFSTASSADSALGTGFFEVEEFEHRPGIDGSSGQDAGAQVQSIAQTALAAAGQDTNTSSGSFDSIAQAATSAASSIGGALQQQPSSDGTRFSQRTARIGLEQLRAQSTRATGSSNCALFSTGYRFTLADHDVVAFNREWVLTQVEHEGSVPEVIDKDARGRRKTDKGPPVYRNTFRCAPGDTPVRPPRPVRPFRHINDTAVVVGPPGEEIYVDSFGRIKIQFVWDKDNPFNERSSCWVRVMQPWAGAGFGFQFIPRIGMEVLVTFTGDAEHPIVQGCLYNAMTTPTHALPDEKTKSGIRTNSSPGGGGSNELMFEDAAGEEQIYLHAQRDLSERVLRDHETHVDGERRSAVGGSRTVSVTGAQTITIGGAHALTIGGDEHATVAGDRHLQVGGTAETLITGENEVRVGGGASLAVAHDLATTVTGNQTTTVGADGAETISSLYTWGQVRVDASKRLHLAAEEGLVISCGGSSIALTPTGVEIDASKIILRGSDSVSLYGDGPVVHLTSKTVVVSDEIKLWGSGGALALDSDAKMFGSGSSLHLDSDAKLAGGSVKISGTAEKPDDKPSESSDSSDPPPTQSLQLTVNDAAGQPIANKPYVLLVLGTKYSGTTDGSGGVTQQVPPEATVGLLTVTVADGHRVQWHLDIATVEAATDVKGAQKRLRNLGYYHGSIDGQLSPSLEGALRRFQRENDITPATGTLDGATSSKLSDVHAS